MEANINLGISELPNRQVYLVCLEGAFDINGVLLKGGDAIKTWEESYLSVMAMENSHLALVDLPKCM